RQRQDEARAARPQALNFRLARMALQVALRGHVVANQTQVGVELFAVENVLALEARDQARLFDVLHRAAQLFALEDLIALELDLDDAHALAFADLEGERAGTCRDGLGLRI